MQKNTIKITAFLTGLSFMIICAFVSYYCGADAGAVAARILLIVFLILCVSMIAFRHHKIKQASRQADNADEYAKNSALYHKDITPPQTNTSFSNVQIPFLQNTVAPPPQKQATDENFTDKEILDEYTAERSNIPDTKDLPKILLNRVIPKTPSKWLLYILVAVAVVLYLARIFINSDAERGLEYAAMMIRLLGFALAVAVIVFLIRLNIQRNTLSPDSVVYKKIIPDILKKQFGNATFYNHTAGFSPQQISKINCLGRKFTSIVGADLISGSYNGNSFSAAQEKIIREYTEYDSDGDPVVHKEEIFKGIMVCLDCRKTSPFPLGIRSNTRNEIINGKLCDSGTTKEHTIKTENEDFNTLFTICCNDEETVFYFLTPDIMEKLSALYNNNYNLYMYIENGKMYFGFNSGHNFLKLSAVNPSPQELATLQQRISLEINDLKKLLDTAVKFI